MPILRLEREREREREREIRTCNTCCLRDIKAMKTVITVFYNQNTELQMLTGGRSYIIIRRAIFGKVHGHGVKGI